VVTLAPGVLDGIVALIRQETQNLKDYFARD